MQVSFVRIGSGRPITITKKSSDNPAWGQSRGRPQPDAARRHLAVKGDRLRLVTSKSPAKAGSPPVCQIDRDDTGIDGFRQARTFGIRIAIPYPGAARHVGALDDLHKVRAILQMFDFASIGVKGHEPQLVADFLFADRAASAPSESGLTR